MAQKDKKIDWHSGFSGGFHLSLRDYKDGLDIEREHFITDEPTRMDLLIIKKNKDVVIDNSIGRAFREHNIIEYKNPNGALNIDVVWKTIGYAGLYKGYGKTVNAIPAKELTITILRSAKPVKLFKYLVSEGYKADMTAPGVYLLSGFIDMPVQVVVIKELKDKVFRPLRIMIPKADENEIRAFLKEAINFERPDDQNYASAVLNISSEANEHVYEKIWKEDGMSEVLERLMKDDIEKREQQVKVLDIKNVMDKLKYTAEQAMDLLDVPSDQRALYAGMVQGK